MIPASLGAPEKSLECDGWCTTGLKAPSEAISRLESEKPGGALVLHISLPGRRDQRYPEMVQDLIIRSRKRHQALAR